MQGTQSTQELLTQVILPTHVLQNSIPQNCKPEFQQHEDYIFCIHHVLIFHLLNIFQTEYQRYNDFQDCTFNFPHRPIGHR